MRILIVEDDGASAHFLKHLAEQFGTCTIASTGEEALRAFGSSLAADPFHVIFLDINLPDFTGHQLLIAIRSIELGFPRSMRARIFITTASADQAEVLKAYLKRCDGYIIKPIDPQLFRNQMTECGIH